MSGGLSLYRLLHGRWSRSPSLLSPGWGQSKNANKSCPPSWGLSKNTQKSFGLSSGTLLKSNSTNMWDFRFQVPPVCTDLCRGEYTVQTDRCQLEMITFFHQNMFHAYFSTPQKYIVFALSLKTMFSCAAHTAPTLACIADGIETLPRSLLNWKKTSIF